MDLFRQSTDTILENLGDKAFRPGRNFNAAVFDSVTFGVAKLLAAGRKVSSTSMKRAFRDLMSNKTYQEATSRSTADKAFVEARLKAAERAFS